MPDLAAVVLAAGAGRRLGGPKALQRWQGRTFLDHVLAALAGQGFAAEVVVTGARGAEVAETVPAAPRRRVVHNEGWSQGGMLSSLLCGLDALPATVAYALVWPVDHPAATAATVRALLEHARATGADILVPAHAGTRGHPVVFSRSTFAALHDAPPSAGARAVVRDPSWHLAVIDVSDAGVLLDVDTPDDLERLPG